ncbi:F-box/LRR-repeat protein 17 isoform X1 [Nilaparvata lugens]|uniref:F-box/LRR-repeat protein 17 isoform X1 n=1 Tax=Nilaparvata lugens TaxID=108931 RepID=UPI00193D6E41|nr:F-box/LRR-repeat protein 17 isoform X1 [Nilaparvata lugens]XP_039293102.1 F-box/LRR-repeat protein 17 isoform X1 [Nilaparvata lugens]
MTTLCNPGTSSNPGTSQPSVKTINDLPEELLINIFLELDILEISTNVMNVCLHWRRVAMSESVWRKLKFVCTNTMESFRIGDYLKRMPLLQRLQVQWRTDVDGIMSTVCSHCNHILEVELVCCGYPDKDLVEKLVQKYPRMTVLSMGKCWQTPAKCYYDVIRFKSLRSLDISNSPYLNNALLRRISLNCPQLEELNIDYVKDISENELILFLSTRRAFLKSLTVFGDMVTDRLLFELSKCEKLERLHISTCCEITIAGVISLMGLASLRYLSLRRATQLEQDKLAQLFYEKKIFQQLKRLYISSKQKIEARRFGRWFNNEEQDLRRYEGRRCACVLCMHGFRIRPSNS